VREPQRDARQGRRADATAPAGGRIDIRELSGAEVAAADACLPLARLDSAQTYLVAWDGDEPVGHAHVAWERTRLGVPEIGDVWVLPERRGEGIGSDLTRAAERLAAARGHDRISLSVSLEQNPGARRLYERLGYRDVGLGRERVAGTILLRGKPFVVDDTLLHLVKDLSVDPGPP
jgi:GNAT superfamily N-acetyltransferase